MRTIPKGVATATYRNDLQYSAAALSVDDDARTLAAGFAEALNQADDMERKERGAEQAVVFANARVAVANVHADRPLMRLGREALVESDGLRDRPPYSLLFAVAPSELVRWPLRKACGYVRDRIAPAAATLPAQSRLRPLIAEAAEKAELAVQALDQRSAAEGARALIRAEVDEWKEGVNRLRLATYADLLKTAAIKGYGREWADAFFPQSDRAVEPPAAPAAPDADPTNP